MVRSNSICLVLCLVATIVAGDASFSHNDRGNLRRRHQRRLELTKEAIIVKNLLGEEVLKDRFDALIEKQNGEAMETDDYVDDEDETVLSTMTYID